MEQVIEQISGELKNVVQLNENLEQEFKSKAESEEELSSKVKKLKKNAKDSGNWMKIAEARIKDLTEANAKVSSSNDDDAADAELRTKLEKAEGAIKDFQTWGEGAQKIMSDKEVEISNLQSEIEGLKTSHSNDDDATASNSGGGGGEEVDALNQQITMMEDEIHKLKSRNDGRLER